MPVLSSSTKRKGNKDKKKGRALPRSGRVKKGKDTSVMKNQQDAAVAGLLEAFLQNQQNKLKDINSNVSIDMSLIREELTRIENEMRLRMEQMEHSVSNLRLEIDKLSANLTETCAAERQKRLLLIRKVYQKHSKEISVLRSVQNTMLVAQGGGEKKLPPSSSSSSRSQIDEDAVEELNEEMSRVRESVDHFLRHYLKEREPLKTKSDKSNDCGDKEDARDVATDVLIQVSKRMKDIEKRMKMVVRNDCGNQMESNDDDMESTREKNKQLASQIQKMEMIQTFQNDSIMQLRAEIDQLKASAATSSTNPKMVVSPNDYEIQRIHRKLKTLGETQAAGIRTLADSLTEVQETTLSLYKWCDKFHKLNLDGNPSPLSSSNLKNIHNEI